MRTKFLSAPEPLPYVFPTREQRARLPSHMTLVSLLSFVALLFGLTPRQRRGGPVLRALEWATRAPKGRGEFPKGAQLLDKHSPPSLATLCDCIRDARVWLSQRPEVRDTLPYPRIWYDDEENHRFLTSVADFFRCQPP